MLNKGKKILPLADQLIVSGANFTLGILITRNIGVEGYGEFTMFWIIFLFLHGLFNAFIGLPAQVLSNSQPNKTEYLTRNNHLATVLLLIILPLLYLGFYVYTTWFNIELSNGIVLFPLVIVLYVKQEVNRKYFYAKEKIQKVVTIDAVTYLSQILGIFILSLQGELTLYTILIVMTGAAVLGQITFYLIKEKATTSFSFYQMPVRVNWQYAKYLIGTSLLQWFSGNIMLTMAASLIGLSAVGAVRILQNIMGVLHVLFLTLENVVPVKASFLLSNHSSVHMFTYLKKVTLFAGFLYAILLLVISFFGAEIIAFLYGSTYLTYLNAFYMFIGVYILVFVNTILQILIKTLQLNSGIFKAYILSSITSLIIAYPLLMNFGVYGIVLGFGILQIVNISMYLLTIKRDKLWA
ncbi:lipopolysaccharide biosynthesis protein [Crocinitomix catalasitica]|uniref:lipopolysaccharide biosynthesis protein n=1 Tax=Crocinitomix catalasitica TaxID=184607 RepID=UPI00048936C9|nr:hypothetical protein [Crocinitomix catalasitica]